MNRMDFSPCSDALCSKRAPNTVKAISAQETGNQAKTIIKIASTNLHKHWDMFVSFLLIFPTSDSWLHWAIMYSSFLFSFFVFPLD